MNFVNIKYIFYVLIKTEYRKLSQFFKKLKISHPEKNNISSCLDMLYCFFIYKTQFLDYFYFKYFEASVDRSQNTNVWDMYLFQKKYNSRYLRLVFKDKIKFRQRFDAFFAYSYVVVRSYEESIKLRTFILDNNLLKIVAKNPFGSAGKSVVVLNIEIIGNEIYINGVDFDVLISHLIKKGFKLYEQFIEQHLEISKIYPNAINTIRVVTFLNDNGEVEFWGTLLRMGYDNQVDNFDSGGLSANINMSTGIVSGKAKIKNPFVNKEFSHHPVSGNMITGVKIPFWDEVLKIIREAAYVVPEVRTVGWDVAITHRGPTLVEGNDNWDKTHFEIVSGVPLGDRIRFLLM